MFDLPYPFEKYDQLFVPEFNAGAMENAGAVTFLESYVFRSTVTEAMIERRGADDPARAGPHVVRRPGDHALVERPVAQRVVRRVGQHRRAGRGDPLAVGLDDVQHRREVVGLPAGPARHDAPDRRQHPRPRGRRGQLRRHHLRQGRLGAQAARGLRRARGVRAGAAAVLQGARLGQHRAGRPARASSRSPAAATWPRGARTGCRRPASTRCARSSRSTTRARSRASPSSRPRPRTTRRCARTGSRVGALRPAGRRSWCAPAGSSSTSAASAPRCRELVGRPRPDLLLVNDDDLAYAKIRLDEHSLATARRAPRRRSSSRCRAR